MKTFARRTHSIWQAAAIAALAVWALGPRALAEGSFGGGDTIGGHPNTQGDNDGEVELRPVFFLEGPRSLVFPDVESSRPFAYNGPGEVIGVPTDDPDAVRLEFSPEMTIRVDMELLADPRVSTGFRVAPRGGTTKVRWDLGSHSSRFETLPINARVELPVTRLRRAGVLQQGLGFTAFHRGSGRTGYSLSTGSCALIVQPD